MNGKLLSLPNNILKHRDSLCVSWYFMYILMYRYYLGTQLLQRQYIYIYIYIALYLHWWFLILDCQVAIWLTS